MSVVLNCHTWFHVTLILKSPTLYMAWDKTVLLLRDRKKTTLMTKLKHQRQKLNVIIPAVSDSPCLQLLALTHFQKLSSRVYSLSVATFKASPPFVPRTKDQLGALCRFLSFTLHATPIFNWQQLFYLACNAWEGRDTLKEKKESSTAILFNCRRCIQIKRTASIMYSPHTIRFCSEAESTGVHFNITRLPWLFSVSSLITNWVAPGRDGYARWIVFCN